MDVMALLHETNPYDGFAPAPEAVFIPGWNLAGDSPLFRKLVALVRPELAIECGTWLGGSAITTATAMRELGLAGRVLCVDSWQGPWMFWDRAYCPAGYEKLRLKHGWPQVYYDFLSNVLLAGVQDWIVPFPQSVEVAFQVLEHFAVRAELIYIDASHEERFVYRDVSEYRTLLAPGGVIFGDDYYHRASDVGRAVHRLFGDDVWTYPYGPDERRFWGHGPMPEGAERCV